MKRLFVPLVVLLALAPPGLAQGSLTLSQSLEALPRTLDWQSADQTYESAVRQLEAALAARGLSLSGGAEYVLREPSGSSLSLSATASLGVFPWSSSADAVASAERGLRRADLTRREARNNLYLSVCTQYFNLRQAQADLEIAQATVALRERQLQIVRTQNQAGSATLSDLLTAQQNLDSALSGLVSAQGALELARLTLASTLGLRPEQLGLPSTAPQEPELPSEGLDVLIQRALAQRPDVLRAALGLEEAQANLASAQRDRLLPNAALSAGYSGASASLSAGLNLKNGTLSLSAGVPLVQGSSTQQGWAVGLSLNLPIADPSAESRISSAQTALKAAELSLDSVRKTAELDVRQKYQNLLTAKASVAAAQSALKAAEQNLSTARARLQAGTGTAVEVQAAELSLRQARRNLEAATAQAQLAGLALHVALGTDLTATLGGIR
ncbi:MAG: TolC family protein [Meiothermus sp.]|uniref:TolC family protein n=1 Tax=Meiothermus sp. TaxID=1955249 RepID=UPI0025DB743C|nr:TolC family protein [Meiothermus sp.]MCS7058081.1 TolC family protein [Meiothermus sp.]MCS7194046.1 TolC family protein [Meiothermus sp.]MCX7740294.1 TolC family protein [Meiothermus sp.]MDW8091178.1 TolC family protein [Meiothermus sp.]MDW8480445.1 TolC family protein [Meiothermus sp.]